jgi:hypothetical protein
MIPGAMLFLVALLTWAVLQAGIAGVENDQHDMGQRITVSMESYIKAVSQSASSPMGIEPLAPAPAPVAEAVMASGYETPRGYWTDAVIAPQMEVMNCWTYEQIIRGIYNGLPEGCYTHLINTGRQLVLNQPVFPCSEDYMKAAVVAYCGFKWDAWMAQMGYSHSRFYGDGLGYVEYLTRRGIPWEFGLIVLEFESNFGGGAPGNPWGFISGSSSIESFCNFASGHTGSVYEFVEWYHNPEDAGHGIYMENFRNRMIQIQAFCP